MSRGRISGPEELRAGLRCGSGIARGVIKMIQGRCAARLYQDGPRGGNASENGFKAVARQPRERWADGLVDPDCRTGAVIGVHVLTTLRDRRAAVIARLGESGYKIVYALIPSQASP